MSEPVIFAIDGAQTMADINMVREIPFSDDAVRIPQMDYTYKFGAIIDGLMWASRDGHKFVLAITVECNGKKATRDEMVKALCS